jgi:alanyl-tRNA synthetase
MLTSTEIRQKFLDFFRSKAHVIVPSAPIVIKNDPTLLFTNAGMNQFKDYFLGNRSPVSPRVADTQKCLRVSGKHNDLEEVGVDTYHHTMFEMLGNWSFGDYFKKEAIEWSWELLTGVLGLEKDRLYVTVFEGDPKEQLPRDDEAFSEWKKWVPADRILLGSKKDNFWEMGDTGPCGPCTEIHVDCRPQAEREAVAGSTLVNNDHPQVIEIWNNVFIQFNRLRDGSLQPLPARHVDTGMGFERLVRVIQGKSSNYDTDVFSGTIEAAEKLTGKHYAGTDDKQSVAFRVLADHIRAIGFTIADGQLPANNGAGYVIRRILRRAVRYYYSYLDYKQPLLYRLLPVIAKQFEGVFPELQQQADFVARVVREEEEAFLRTLDKGLKKMEDIMVAARGSVIDGAAAFELYDTYGFPIDLTRLIAGEQGLQVDEAAFGSEMKRQKERSRAATALDTEDWQVIDSEAQSRFVGYDSLETAARLIKYRRVRNKGRESFQLVLDQTPFYAESGGQVGDRGVLFFGNEPLAVTDTRKENDLFIHFTASLPEDPEAALLARVDRDLRRATAMHHTATHLLHAALRRVLGTHVQQKGSLVSEDQLRFDFSHFAKLSPEEIRAVEEMVNEKIRANIPVQIRQMPKEDALKLGAMALFGEKYGDQVRVVVIDPEYSVELCGGTHVGATGELGIFKIRQETAVAAGVRRIEALSGRAAELYLRSELRQLEAIREQLRHPPEISRALEGLLEENATLKKKQEHLEGRLLVGIRNELLQKDEIIQNISFLGQVVEVVSPDALKKLCMDIKHHLHDHVIVLCSNIGGKPYVAIGIADTVVAARQLDASRIIKEKVAPLIKGGGGGQKTLATAGGQDASSLPQVIAAVRSLL